MRPDFVMSIGPTRYDVSLDYVLELDIVGCLEGGRYQVHYRLFCNDLMIFDNDDASIPALGPNRGLERAAIDLLGLLSVQDGDTDDEFFDNYSALQLRWRDLYAEDLSCAFCGEDE